MKTVLVTGAGGYIGCVLTRKLLETGYRVRAVDRFFFGRDKLASHANLEIICEDTRKLTLDNLARVDYVIDLVAISNDPSAELFADETMAINFEGRVRCATLARQAGAARYVFPSSASIYGYQREVVSESSPTNPLTVYSRANEMAERGVLELSSDEFIVTVIRQATVFGLSPRMRFDLAINGMTYGAVVERRLPLMRDGSQYRPMVHIEDTTDLMLKLLTVEPELVNGEIFNVGHEQWNFQIGDLATRIAGIVTEATGSEVAIAWYGDPDHRSYRLDFTKIQQVLGWYPQKTLDDGVKEIVEAINGGTVDKTEMTLTLNWYDNLTKWYQLVKEVEMYGGILDIK